MGLIEKIRANLNEASKFYDEYVFNESGGWENPDSFKKNIISMILRHNLNLRNKKLLDVGCGNGNFLQLAEFFFKTYGTDISKNAIENAKKRCKNSILQVSPAEKLKFNKEFFDVIVCLGSLEHFVNMGYALKKMHKILKKNGIAVLHVPNSNYLIHIIHKLLGVRVERYFQINERRATENEWKGILEKYFEIIKCYKYNEKWYFAWIPKKYCYHFTFLCKK